RMPYRARSSGLVPAGLAGAILSHPATAHAHEKWFIDASAYPTSWTTALRPPELIGVAVALALTAVAGLAWRALDRRNLIPGPETLGAGEESRTKFYALVPLILGVHVAVPLLALALQGDLFSPNNHLEGASVYWLGVVQIGVSLSILYGGLARLAAIALAALWLTGGARFGLHPSRESPPALG